MNTSSVLDSILDDAGNRIGIMTPGGPIYALDPVDAQLLAEANERAAVAKAARHKEKDKKLREQKMTELLKETDVNPALVPGTLTDITIEERWLMELAFRKNQGDCVPLPYAVTILNKRRELKPLTKDAVGKRIDRAARRLYNRGLATIEIRDDGLKWLSVSRERVVSVIRKEASKKASLCPPTFNLIKVPCEIPTSQKQRVKADPLAMPKRCSLERLRACKLISGLKMLSRPDKVEVNYLFETYNDNVNEKIIALLDLKKDEVIGSEYSTRFNDLSKAARSLNRFDVCLETSLREHSKAVFLTLTTDPNLTDEDRAAAKAARIDEALYKLSLPYLTEKSRKYWQRKLYRAWGPDYEISDLEERLSAGEYSPDQAKNVRHRIALLQSQKEEAEKLYSLLSEPSVGIRTKERIETALKKMGRWQYKHDPNGFSSIWEANRSFSKAWNKFLSYLTKRNDGIRPRYIASYEYTDSGLMHVHALIFLEMLPSNEEISREWKRCGQGEISYVYGLRNIKSRDGKKREWRWNSQSRPSDAKTMSGGDYLKKYVKKCLLAMMDRYTSPSEIQSLYWVFNKRMYTNSRSLDTKEDSKGENVDESESDFIFLKVYTSDEAEEMVDRMVYHRSRPEWQCLDPPDGVST